MGLLDFITKRGGSAVSASVGFATGAAASEAIRPAVQPLANEIWSSNPTMPTPMDVAAQVAIKNPGMDDDMRKEARKQGFGDAAFNASKDAADSPPAVGELLELYRRGDIDHDRLIHGLRGALLESSWLDILPALAKVLLTPSDLAMARQQGFIDVGEQHAGSARQGVDSKDADLLFEMSGLPPGIAEGLELLRRGEITEEHFAQIVREGHTKTKYVEDLLKLKTQPLSASVAAEALIRQRVPKEKAVRIAEQNGYKPEDFLLWSDMLGRPIAIGESLTLARRGEFTFEQFRDAVARSDVRTEFADDLWKLRTVYPPLFQLLRLVKAGTIDEKMALDITIKLGYTPELAHSLISGAKVDKTAHTRHLAAGQIDTLYESGLETREWALAALTNLGYGNDEAEWHLELLEARRLIAAAQSAVNLVHRNYVSRKISVDRASADLDSIGVHHDARDLLLDQWGNEREEHILTLTNAQIGRALKLGIINEGDAISRWIGNGYSQDDASVLAQMAGHRASGTNPTGG